MKKLFLSLCLVLFALTLMAGEPQVYDVLAEQQGDVVVINYYLLHPDEMLCNITVEASADGGETYDIVPTALSGDIGVVTTTAQGAPYQIIWNYALDNVDNGTNYRVKVIADDEIPTIPSPNVVVLTAVDLPLFVQMDEYTLVMTLAAPPNYYALGTILMMAPCAQIPMGIMRKVVSSFIVGNLVYIETVSAKLEEAFQQVQFSYSEALKASDLVSTESLLDGVTFLPSAKDFTLPTINIDVEIPLSEEVSFTVDGTVEITLGYKFIVSHSLFKGVHRVEAGGHGTVESTVELGVNGGFSVEKNYTLGRYFFGIVTFMAGPVPVWFTPSVEAVLQLEAGGSAGVSAGATAIVTFGAGVIYDKYATPKWSTYSSLEHELGFIPPSLSVGLNASAAVGPQLELNLYSVAGPYVFAGAFLSLDANLLADPWWILTGGFKVDAGIEFEVLSFEISWGTTVIEYSEELARALTPAPQEAAAPTFNPGAGTYGSTQNVTISSTTTGATIYYTLDGTTPTTSSNLYSGAVAVTGSATLKARAYKDGYNPSPIASAEYTITASYVEGPTFSPAAGSFLGSLNVTLSCSTAGATIYYTTDGSVPTESSMPYNNPFTISSTTTVRAKAFKDGHTPSYTVSAHYVFLTQYTFTPVADASIHFTIPNTNDSSSERLTVRNGVGHPQYPPPPANWNIDTLVRFNLSNISSSADIASAKLKLYYYDNKDNDPAGRTLSLFRATQPWNEATVTWNNQPTWAGAASATSTVPADVHNWMEWDVTTDVRAFVNGTNSNYGWKITDLAPWNNYNIPLMYFFSREYGSLSGRPKLVVELYGKGDSAQN